MRWRRQRANNFRE
jgi:phosphatidylserine/phosphatidylglycerophosphate/cardiolipin synthase-like enzyme